MFSTVIGPNTIFYEEEDCHRMILEQRENYELHVQDALRSVLPSSTGFLDIGANVGYFTAAAKWWKSYGFPTTSIEVNPVNASCLLKTIDWNGWWNSIVYPMGASDYNGFAYGTKCWNTGLSISEINKDWRFTFPVVRIDDLPIGGIDVVKMDVEGFELRALKGMQRLISNLKPVIVFEYNIPAMSITGCLPMDLLGFFTERNYELTVLDYKPGMRADFKDPATCRDHIAKFSDICDIMAKPI